jgi:hypothetical protein
LGLKRKVAYQKPKIKFYLIKDKQYGICKLINVRGAAIIPARIAEKNKTAHTSNYNFGFETIKGNFDGKIKLRASAGEKQVIQE